MTYEPGTYVIFNDQLRVIHGPVEKKPGYWWLESTPSSPSRACVPESELQIATDIPQDDVYVIDVETATDEELLEALDKLENDRLFHSVSKSSAVKKKERRKAKTLPTDIDLDLLERALAGEEI